VTTALLNTLGEREERKSNVVAAHKNVGDKKNRRANQQRLCQVKKKIKLKRIKRM